MDDTKALQALVGLRIRRLRKRQQRTQVAVAQLSGITQEYLAMIEKGRRMPSFAALASIARTLGTDLSALLRQPQTQPRTVDCTAAYQVVRVFMGHNLAERESAVVGSAHLRDRVEDAWRIWQSSPSRFTQIEAVLPALLSDIENALHVRRHSHDAAERRETLRAASDLYNLMRSYLRRTGRTDLALLAAERAVRAAEDADDPLRIAAGRWNMGHVLLSQEHSEAASEADDVAAQAIDALHQEPAVKQGPAMVGALELVRTLAAARMRQWPDARARLEETALPLGRDAGETNVARTVFGPTNCHLHALTIEMLAGDATAALRVADSIDTTSLPSRERSFTFGLEVARCYDLRREDPAVIVHLLELEELATEDFHRTPAIKTMVLDLLHRVRPIYRTKVTALAERMQLV